MVLWFSRKNKSAPREGQAARNNSSLRVNPSPSSRYYNVSSSSSQAVTLAIPATQDSSYVSYGHGALRQHPAPALIQAYSSPAPPSRPLPCDVCAVWIKAFEGLRPDDFVRSAALFETWTPSSPPYRVGAAKPGGVRLLIEQHKAENGEKESFGCSIVDDEERSSNIYCTKDLPCPWGLFPTGTGHCNLKDRPAFTDQVISGTGIDSCVTVAELWLHDCMKNHKCVPEQNLQPLPTRVISIGETVHDLKLIETDHFHGRYVCLSYCWGVNKTYDTTTKNRADRLRGIQYADMPKTYQDAVTMCHRLGIAFLWIDALCILQDSPADSARESAQMADIYSRSFLTLAGNGAANVHAGLFHSTRQPEACGTTAQGQPFRYLVARNGHFFGCWDDPTIFPLMTRAWVFQEFLLAPRTLHFEQAELSWTCYAQRMCECNGAMNQDFKIKELRDPACDPRALAFQWRQLIVRYSSKALSYPTDKLPALSGLAHHFQQRRKDDTYLAGLWRKSLLDDMLWYVTAKRQRKQPKPTVWRAPSWSWASNDSEIDYVSPADREHSWKSRVLVSQPWVFAAECTLAGVDPTGLVTAGHVMLLSRALSGRLKLRKASKQQFHYDLYLPGVDGREDIYTTEDVPATVAGRRTQLRRIWLDHVQPNAPGSDRPRKTMEVRCFHMSRFETTWTSLIGTHEPFLILEAVDDTAQEAATTRTYQRIGIGSTRVDYWNSEQSARQEATPIENVMDLIRQIEGPGFTDAEKQAFWKSSRSSFREVGSEEMVIII